MKSNTEIPPGFLLRISLVFLMILFSVEAFSQADRKYIRKGNREYSRGNYSGSEVLYRKATNEGTRSPEATFNIGDALYRQDKFEDAGKQFADNTTQTVDAEKQAAGWYNLGNSLLQANKVKESIEAYKNSLKLYPENKAAKYNLGYAQNLLKEQEQQQQQQQQNRNNEQQKQDQQQKKQDNDQGKNENQLPQPQDQQQQGQEEQQEQGISKEDAERLLNALANDEKNIQERVKREKAARARTRTLKNW